MSAPTVEDMNLIRKAQDEGKLHCEGVTDFEEKEDFGWDVMGRDEEGKPIEVVRYCSGPFSVSYSLKK